MVSTFFYGFRLAPIAQGRHSDGRLGSLLSEKVCGRSRFIKFTALSSHTASDSESLTQDASINRFLFQYAFRPVE